MSRSCSSIILWKPLMHVVVVIVLILVSSRSSQCKSMSPTSRPIRLSPSFTISISSICSSSNSSRRSARSSLSYRRSVICLLARHVNAVRVIFRGSQTAIEKTNIRWLLTVLCLGSCTSFYFAVIRYIILLLQANGQLLKHHCVVWQSSIYITILWRLGGWQRLCTTWWLRSSTA